MCQIRSEMWSVRRRLCRSRSISQSVWQGLCVDLGAEIGLFMRSCVDLSAEIVCQSRTAKVLFDVRVWLTFRKSSPSWRIVERDIKSRSYSFFNSRLVGEEIEERHVCKTGRGIKLPEDRLTGRSTDVHKRANETMSVDRSVELTQQKVG